MAGASCLGDQEAAECAGVVTSFQQQVQGTGVLRARWEADVGHPAWGFFHMGSCRRRCLPCRGELAAASRPKTPPTHSSPHSKERRAREAWAVAPGTCGLQTASPRQPQPVGARQAMEQG